MSCLYGIDACHMIIKTFDIFNFKGAYSAFAVYGRFFD